MRCLSFVEAISHNRKQFIEHEDVKYYTGLEIICRKRFNEGKYTFNVNYTYEIIKFDEESVWLRDICDDEEIEICIGKMNHFSLPYCMTCHSVQGLSIAEEITIFDANIPYVDRNWIWTAISRATDLNNITIFEHSKEEVRDLKCCKIQGYKEQDRKCYRKFKKEDYIDYNWVRKQGMHCIKCNKLFDISFDKNNNVTSDMTIDRINNNVAHVKDNCQIMCLQCNCTKR